MVPGLVVFCGWGWEDVGNKAVFSGFADFFEPSGFVSYWVLEMYDDTAADGQILMDPFSCVTPRSKREVARCDSWLAVGLAMTCFVENAFC